MLGEYVALGYSLSVLFREVACRLAKGDGAKRLDSTR